MKKSRIIFLIFIIFGLILSVGGALLCLKVFDYDNKVETTAVITDFESYRDGEGSTRYKTHLTYDVMVYLITILLKCIRLLGMLEKKLKFIMILIIQKTLVQSIQI